MKTTLLTSFAAFFLLAGCTKADSPQKPAGPVTLWDGTAATQPDDLDATAKTATILRASDLAWLSQNCNAAPENTFEGWVFTLGADLDLADKDWAPIGHWSDENPVMFKGTFDGAGHSIERLRVDTPQSINSGLFGVVQGGVIRDLHVAGSVIGQNNTAGICANAQGKTRIENCTFSGEVMSHTPGGITGWTEEATVSRCHCSARILYLNGDSHAGGIAGFTVGSTISDCLFDGSIESGSDISEGMIFAGGIIGNSGAGTTVSGCRNKGNLTITNMHTSALGGIAGFITSSRLVACYNTGLIANEVAEGFTGGIFGYGDDELSTVRACYNTGKLTLADDEAADQVATNYEINRWRSNVDIEACYFTADAVDAEEQPGILRFSVDNWPQDDAGKDWGVGSDTSKGQYWKSLGSPIGMDYPMLWWE